MALVMEVWCCKRLVSHSTQTLTNKPAKTFFNLFFWEISLEKDFNYTSHPISRPALLAIFQAQQR